MTRKKQMDDIFNISSNDDISGLASLSGALNLINNVNAVTSIEQVEPKKFIIKKKEELKELVGVDFYEKLDNEYDEIANQADSAFEEMMDMAINAPINSKAVGDLSNAAQKFLETKLSAKTAKLEKKFKMLTSELAQRKQQFLEDTKKAGAIIVDEDNDDTPAGDGKIPFDREKYY